MATPTTNRSDGGSRLLGRRSLLKGALAGGIGLVARNVGSESLMRTDHGVDRSDTSAHASSIDIAGGAITIGSVDVSSTSSVTGNKGENTSRTRISINDIAIGGVKFSIADDQIVLATMSRVDLRQLRINEGDTVRLAVSDDAVTVPVLVGG